MRVIFAVLGFLLLAVSAGAVEPDEMLKDPVLEARAREVSKELRCVQCQNESIDESNAEIAHDMRVLVRQRITAGDSNAQIIAYMTSRYGDYVRLMPRFMPKTLLLWFGPLAVLVLGGVAVMHKIRSAAPTAAAPLSEEERAAIEALQARGDNV